MRGQEFLLALENFANEASFNESNCDQRGSGVQRSETPSGLPISTYSLKPA